MTAVPRVRMRLLLPDAQALSSVLLDASPAAAERLCDQLWLRTVLVEQRRRTPRAERARFDARADQILQQLDPDPAGEGIASEPPSAPPGSPMNTVEDRRAYQEHDRALIAQFAPDAAAIAAEQRRSGCDCSDRHFERRLKNRHEAPRLCPRCVAAGATAGRGLLLAGSGEPIATGGVTAA